MFEHFSEKLADGTLKAELLSHFVSLFEEEQQDMKKLDPSRQYNLQLDSRLTITTKRRHLSSEPADEKGLRMKYAIMTNLWLLAQMRQPVRSIYQGLDRCTFNDFLDTVLDKDNFKFYNEVEGRALISPSWSFFVSRTSSSYAKKLFVFARNNNSVFGRPSGPLYGIPGIV